MLLRWMFSSSLRRYSFRKVINASISNGGRFHAGAVAGDARQEAAIGPPPVAIHDHRDVTGQTRKINLFEQHFVPRAGLYYFKEIFQHCRCNGGAFDSDLMFMSPRKGQKTGVEY